METKIGTQRGAAGLDQTRGETDWNQVPQFAGIHAWHRGQRRILQRCSWKEGGRGSQENLFRATPRRARCEEIESSGGQIPLEALRAITPIVEAVSELAARFDVPLVDAEQLVTAVSEHQIPGSQWLVDHVHPTIEGHQLIGEAIADKCVQTHFTTPTNADWKLTRKELYAEHLRGLGEAYFHRGKQRLEGLKLWTQGRAKKARTATP